MGDEKRSNSEQEIEANAKDTEKEIEQNPTEFEWPKEDMPLDEAADFWKDVIDGMAQFEIDVER